MFFRCLIYKVQALVRLRRTVTYSSTLSFACQALFSSFAIFSFAPDPGPSSKPLSRTLISYHTLSGLSRPFFDSLESFLTFSALAGPSRLALDYTSKSSPECQPLFSTFFDLFRRPSPHTFFLRNRLACVTLVVLIIICLC